MPKPLRVILSLIFIGQMYLAMAFFALIFAIPALINRNGAYAGVHIFCKWVRLTARLLVGLKSEIRGEVPAGEVIIAAKHQSFFDIIILCSVLPQPKFVMKRELIYTPILGQFALRIGCIAVDRGKKGAAIARLKEDAARSALIPGQMVVYPQGTRVAPGGKKPYKIGVGLLYEQFNQPCIPVATNVGLFWPRHGIMRQPGLAVVEFLATLPPGIAVDEFMRKIETQVEQASHALMHEAGWKH